METTKTSLVIALALAAAAAGCSSDEPAAESDYPQPAASVGDEATPEETLAEPTTPQSQAAPEPMLPQQPLSAAPSATVPEAPSAGEAPAESLRDAQISKITDLVHAGEIDQAKLAKTRAQNPRVQKFAANMIAQHTRAKQDGMQLTKSASIVLEQSPVAGELEAKSAQILVTLTSVDASSFDNVYMSAQVQQHQEVLALLTTKLIPSATDAKLKSQLEEARTMVQRHLTEAKQIHQALGSD